MARLVGTGAPAAKPSRAPAPAAWRHAHSGTAWCRYRRWSSTPLTVAVVGRVKVKSMAWRTSTTVARV